MTTRGNTTERGYGNNHQKLRATVKLEVDAGNATCWRCTQPISPTEPWHLGHDDNDRTKYNGPEHVRCNVGAPRRTSHISPCDTSRLW